MLVWGIPLDPRFCKPHMWEHTKFIVVEVLGVSVSQRFSWCV